MILVLGLSDKYNHYAVKPQPGYRGDWENFTFPLLFLRRAFYSHPKQKIFESFPTNLCHVIISRRGIILIFNFASPPRRIVIEHGELITRHIYYAHSVHTDNFNIYIFYIDFCLQVGYQYLKDLP